MSQIDQKELVIIGYGPAGLGASLAAYESGLQGILAFDPSKRIGAGGLHGLDILSNSKGSYFTELLPQLLPGAARLEIARELSKITGLVELTKAAELLESVAQEAIREKVVEVERAQVNRVTKLPNGYHIHTPDRTVEAEWLVLAPGGVEVLLDELAKRNELHPLQPAFTSGEIFRNKRREDLDELLRGEPRVVIVGDSHGAYSVADKLLKTYPNLRVDFHKNSRTRPFFESIDEAGRLGYEVSESDLLCPETGYLNRFNGIRGDARQLWLKERNGLLEDQVRTFYNVALSEIDQDVVIVQATGYRPRKVEIVDGDNIPLDYVTKPTKEGFAKIQEGANGPTFPNAFAIGLGHSSTDATTFYQKQAISAFELLR